jgi:hypothetical protein
MSENPHLRGKPVSRDATKSTSSLDVARRVLRHDAAAGGSRDTAIVAAELQRACTRVCENLQDAMGADGCTALLARALARTETHHPALTDIRRLDEGSIHLDGVVASVATHGVAGVATAIEALVAALIEILGRLIGEDMAIRLIEHDATGPRTNGKAQGP